MQSKLLLIPDFISTRVFVSISCLAFPGRGIWRGMTWGTETEPAVIFSQQWSLKNKKADNIFSKQKNALRNTVFWCDSLSSFIFLNRENTRLLKLLVLINLCMILTLKRNKILSTITLPNYSPTYSPVAELWSKLEMSTTAVISFWPKSA